MSYENEHQHDHNHDYHHDQHHDQHQDQHQESHGDHGAPEHEQPAEASVADVADAAVAALQPVSDSARLDAIEAAISALKASIDDLRDAHAAKPPQPEPAPAPAAIADTEADADEEPAVDPSIARFDALDGALAELKSQLGSVSGGIAQVSAAITSLKDDVDSHRGMHSETQSLIDEQQNLMRGLNYIITTAIGTLTSAAKAGK